MSNLLLLREHFHEPVKGFDFELKADYQYAFPHNRRNEIRNCVAVYNKDKIWHVQLSYFVGVDWVSKTKAIYVEPKLNDESRQTDYLQMLFSALKHPEIFEHTKDLFEIKWGEEQIEITQEQDLLTPLLVVQFLRLMKQIVRKGLKKSYYKVEQNLFGRVKGKVMVSQTIKQNLVKNKPLNTLCSFDEFGLNNPENRLLKKALVFVQRYLPTYKNLNSRPFATEMFNYINPAFDQVSEEIDITLVKHSKFNAFYKEYAEGIRLAKLILKRFGYNITNTQQQSTINTPPFWIDMSKLFELYVLGLLKDKFGHSVEYHFYRSGNELDYLLDNVELNYQLVIDAKYKTVYKDRYDIDDIRQISGYARLKKVYEILKKDKSTCIDCLVIYPENGGHLKIESDLKENEIGPFVNFYKYPIRLPVIAN